MSNRGLACIGYSSLTFGALSTMIYIMQLSIKENVALLFFMVWLLAPYLIMGVVLTMHRESRYKILSDCIACCISVTIALAVLIDIKYIHPDPQGPIAILMVPIIQSVIFVLMTLILPLITRKNDRGEL